jgi:AhpD family alkylhydroperoxidase
MSANFPERRNELEVLLRRLSGELPGPMGGFASLHRAATVKSALDTKTKELIALGIAVAIRCGSCVAFHVHDALGAGATRAEILETLGVAVMMGGGPAAMYACDPLARWSNSRPRISRKPARHAGELSMQKPGLNCDQPTDLGCGG